LLNETFSNYLVLKKKIFEFIIPHLKTFFEIIGVLFLGILKFLGELFDGFVGFFFWVLVLGGIFGGIWYYVINDPRCITGDCENGNGQYDFDNGSTYTGEFEDGKPHGRGTLYFYEINDFNEREYVGDFRYGRYDGVGKLEFISTNPTIDNKKLTYIGEFKEGKRNGRGILTDSYGNKYDGYFKDGYIHGEGTFYFSNGEIKYGSWTYCEPEVTPKSSD